MTEFNPYKFGDKVTDKDYPQWGVGTVDRFYPGRMVVKWPEEAMINATNEVYYTVAQSQYCLRPVLDKYTLDQCNIKRKYWVKGPHGHDERAVFLEEYEKLEKKLEEARRVIRGLLNERTGAAMLSNACIAAEIFLK